MTIETTLRAAGLTTSRVEALRQEAARAGDYVTVDLCTLALDGELDALRPGEHADGRRGLRTVILRGGRAVRRPGAIREIAKMVADAAGVAS